MGMAIGFSFPFQIATGSLGHFSVTEDELSAVDANLRSLLLTNWGERVMHYNLGGNLREFLFEPKNRGELKTRIADRVISQVGKWMPFVIIKNLNVLFSEDAPEIPENAIRLAIAYGLSSKPDLQGSTTFLVL